MQVQNLSVAMPTVSQTTKADANSTLLKEPPTAAEIQAWIASYLADLLEIEPDEVEVTIPFDQYGLDSAAAVGMTGDMEDWLGCKLDPTLLYDYPTVEALARHLAEELKVTV
jgi:acyl carrier protein